MACKRSGVQVPYPPLVNPYNPRTYDNLRIVPMAVPNWLYQSLYQIGWLGTKKTPGKQPAV